jgi:hypothetical protein
MDVTLLDQAEKQMDISGAASSLGLPYSASRSAQQR